PSKRPQSAKQIADELIEIQKAATWSAIFDRRSRVDIRLRWSKTTKEQLLQYGLHPSEFGFVLQQIEDGLIAVDDERLKSQDSIDIEPEVLAIAVEAYFAAKKEASRIRQQRLKSEIALGGVRPAKPSQATEIVIPSARPPITDSTLRLKHLLMGIGLVSSIALAIFTLNREKKPAPSLTSKPQHSTSLSSLGTKPNPSTPEVASPPTQAPPPVPKRDPTTTQSWIFKPGTLLTYSVTTTNQGGHSQTVEQKREIWAITPLRITWFVDGRIRLFSSRAFFANEIFFSSTLPNPGTPVEEPFDFHPVRLRHTVQYTIADQKTQSSDSVKCTPIRREYEQHPTLGSLNAWDIQCLRTVTIQGQVTHLITETYRYSPDGDFVLSAQQKNERITHDGKTVIVGYREMKLDNRRSRFER
ncbi:MAG: hypothetical protein RBT63_10070, partial [Bdellovibrionales bacterium]|nr:hypothetical protein [Bdellovibrionales bacterium]